MNAFDKELFTGAFAILRQDPNKHRALKEKIRHMLQSSDQDPLLARARLHDHIQGLAEDGRVGVITTSTDCDHCTTSHGAVVSAHALTLEKLEREALEWAEGPTSFRLVRPSFLDDFEPQFRDRIAEAHENGRPHCVVQ